MSELKNKKRRQVACRSWHRTFKYGHDDKFFTGGQKGNLGNFYNFSFRQAISKTVVTTKNCEIGGWQKLRRISSFFFKKEDFSETVNHIGDQVFRDYLYCYTLWLFGNVIFSYLDQTMHDKRSTRLAY